MFATLMYVGFRVRIYYKSFSIIVERNLHVKDKGLDYKSLILPIISSPSIRIIPVKRVHPRNLPFPFPLPRSHFPFFFFLLLMPFSKIMLTYRTTSILLQPSPYTLRMEYMRTWQSHTVLPFLKIAVTDDTHFSVILLFFVLFWFVLVDGKSPDILFRHASLFGTHSPCQHMNKLHKRATIAKLHNKRPRSPPITSIPSIHGSKLFQHHIHKIQRILLLSSFLDKRWKRLSLPLLKFWVHGGHFT